MWGESQMIVLGGVYNNVTATVGDSGVSRVASGKSPLTSPEGGWNDDLLPDIFSRRLPRVSPVSTLRPNSTSTSSPPAGEPSSKGQKPKAGVLAGGIVAGTFPIMIILAWYIIHQRQKRHPQTAKSEEPKPEPDVDSWQKPELEDNSRFELSGSCRPLPELPEGGREVGELPSHYMGVELRDASQRAGSSLGTPSQPAELPVPPI
ncbi:MAG: hypothetical protein LQ348_007322 [Seirophora lacunosa]|nr:MAG: hypothetical protein LQ348_007322 [Seirophora lacunosa]